MDTDPPADESKLSPARTLTEPPDPDSPDPPDNNTAPPDDPSPAERDNSPPTLPSALDEVDPAVIAVEAPDLEELSPGVMDSEPAVPKPEVPVLKCKSPLDDVEEVPVEMLTEPDRSVEVDDLTSTLPAIPLVMKTAPPSL